MVFPQFGGQPDPKGGWVPFDDRWCPPALADEPLRPCGAGPPAPHGRGHRCVPLPRYWAGPEHPATCSALAAYLPAARSAFSRAKSLSTPAWAEILPNSADTGSDA